MANVRPMGLTMTRTLPSAACGVFELNALFAKRFVELPTDPGVRRYPTGVQRRSLPEMGGR